MSSEDDLRSLSPVEPGADVDAQVGRMARAELAASRGPRWRVVASRALTRVAIPAAVTVTVVGYLHWAVEAASALYR